jgi:hypothetical protein
MLTVAILKTLGNIYPPLIKYNGQLKEQIHFIHHEAVIFYIFATASQKNLGH